MTLNIYQGQRPQAYYEVPGTANDDRFGNFENDTYRQEYYVLIHVKIIFVGQRSRSQIDLKVGRV